MPEHGEFAAFETEVRRAAERLGDPRQLSVADIERTAAGIPRPPLTLNVLEAALQVELSALPRLLQSLVLLEVVADTPHGPAWAPVLRRDASQALWRLGVVRLFDLRIRLLDALIADPRARGSRAELHFQRANSRRALNGHGEGADVEVLADLVEAARLARRDGEVEFLADAVAVLVRVTAERDPTSDAAAAAGAQLEEVLALPVPPERRALLLQAKAQLVRRRDPAAAATLLQEAVQNRPVDDPFRWELGADQVLAQVEAGAGGGAVQEARRLLCELTERASDTVVALVHHALGYALESTGAHAEARVQFEHALVRTRGADWRNEAATRLRLARLALLTSDQGLWRQQFAVLHERLEALSAVMRRDLAELTAEAARRGMAEQSVAITLIEQAAVSTVGRDRSLLLRLQRARLTLEAAESFDLAPLLREATSGQPAPNAHALALELACNYGQQLDVGTLRHLVDDARASRCPGPEARLLDHLGERDGAVAVLRRALAGDLDRGERLSCTHLLCTLLPDDARDERLAMCRNLESLLATGEAPATIRIDLAACYRLIAKGDRSLLEQAWTQGTGALPGLHTPGMLAHGHRVVAHIVADTVHASLGRSEPDVAERARWLLGEHPVAAEKLAELRHAVAHNLLVLGPIVHPVALDVASQLLELTPNIQPVRSLRDRIMWIRDMTSDVSASLPRPGGPSGPADGLPLWLIRLVADRTVHVRGTELDSGLGAVALVLHARPDVADAVLARLVREHGVLAPSTRDDLYRRVHDEVSGPTLGAGAWTKLERALGEVEPRTVHRLTPGIVAEIQRARDGVPRMPQPAADPEVPLAPHEQAWQNFDRAVVLMRLVNHEPHHSETPRRIRNARVLLAEAVDIARREKMSELLDLMISMGNAWKMPPGADVERAIELYEAVASGELDTDRRARLWKVHGDALKHRGRPEDLRQAFELLQQSARARTGWERAESLLHAAGVARVHPDLSKGDRLGQAAELMVDASRADAKHVADVLDSTLRTLGEWQATSPKDERPNRLRAELRERYPHRAAEIDRPARQPSKRLVEQVVAAFSHPASMAYMRTAGQLRTQEQASRDTLGTRTGGRGCATDVEGQTAQESILGNADRMQAALTELDSDTGGPDAAPGIALARMRLTAELCRIRRADIDQVRRASSVARAAAMTVPDREIRAFLLRENARTWCSNDHLDDAVRDFALAFDLAREATKLEGGEDLACTDTLELLARAERYRPNGAIAEARRLYQLLAERAQAEGNADLAANALNCLADAESQGAQGDRLTRLRAAELVIQRALALASTPYKRAEYTSGLAWQQTQIAMQLDGKARVDALRKALALFDTVDQTYLEENHERRNHRLNRTVCLGALTSLTEGRHAEVAVWRAELITAQAEGQAHMMATIQHNLANALLMGTEHPPGEIMEGVALCEKAAAVRTLTANPRHHWETSLLAGTALVAALAPRGPRGGASLPWPETQTWDRARGWLRKAVKAAQVLGPGEELATAAGELAALARTARNPRDAIEVAEEAWRAMSEAMPFLLLHQESASQESARALDVALALSWRLMQEGAGRPNSDFVFAMDGDGAKIVLRWLLRAFAPVRRPLLARLHRPEAVGLDVWGDWQAALARRDAVGMVQPLLRVREVAPAFLGAEGDLRQTWRWIRARPGAIAVTVVLAQPWSVVLVLSVAADGRERIQVMGAPMSAPPFDADALWPALAEATSANAGTVAMHDAMLAWARKQLVEPLLRNLKVPPSAVLWCPGQVLRLIAPSALWGTIPVALVAAPLLPDLTSAPPRGRGTLIVLADPARGPGDLHGEGSPSVARLEQVASRRAAVRVLASAGERHGAEVGGLTALAAAASPAAVLEAAPDHDVVVVIAHGEAPSAEAAAILLLDEHGAVQRLDVATLTAHPGAFTGATALLLSCETGRVGGAFHDPAGIAGALIAAGAKAVVAPLWPVRLDVARGVAEAVLHGLADGREPFEVLAAMRATAASSPTSSSSVTLGPAAPLSKQAGLADLQRLAFVTWVG